MNWNSTDTSVTAHIIFACSLCHDFMSCLSLLPYQQRNIVYRWPVIMNHQNRTIMLYNWFWSESLVVNDCIIYLLNDFPAARCRSTGPKLEAREGHGWERIQRIEVDVWHGKRMSRNASKRSGTNNNAVVKYLGQRFPTFFGSRHPYKVILLFCDTPNYRMITIVLLNVKSSGTPGSFTRHPGWEPLIGTTSIVITKVVRQSKIRLHRVVTA